MNINKMTPVKNLEDLKVGDYIYRYVDADKWHTDGNSPYIGMITSIEDINNNGIDYRHFYIRIFGKHPTSQETLYNLMWKVPSSKLQYSVCTWETPYGLCSIQAYPNVEKTGLGKYRYNKAKDIYKQEYTLVQENVLFKDRELDMIDLPNGDCQNIYNYSWNKPSDLVVYRAEYDNEDGPLFIRHAEDFYNNFTRVG